MEQLTNDELGQNWANKFIWYLMMAKAGKKLLDDDTHARLTAELRRIDDLMEHRGLPVDRRYVDAFESLTLLDDETMRRLMIRAYGRPMAYKEIKTA